MLKILAPLTMAAVVLVTACTPDGAVQSKLFTDTNPPIMTLQGLSQDTAYIMASYKDPGVILLDDQNGQLRCPDDGCTVVVTGTVNTSLPGTNVLNYQGFDKAGNEAPSVTRTVHVVQHPLSKLAGLYDVACTCTTTAKSGQTQLTTSQYTTVASVGTEKNLLHLSVLKPGGDDVVPAIRIRDEEMQVNFYSRLLHVASGGTGLIDSSGESFTMQTTSLQYEPDITYECRHDCRKKIELRAHHETEIRR